MEGQIKTTALSNCHWTVAEVAEHLALSTHEVNEAFKTQKIREKRETLRKKILRTHEAYPEFTVEQLAFTHECSTTCVHAALGVRSFNPKRGEVLALAMHYATEHPEATAKEISDATPCSLQRAYDAKRAIAEGKPIDPTLLPKPVTPRKPPKRVAHSIIATFAVDNYHLTQDEIAEHFGISKQPVITAFKRNNVAQRRATLVHGVRNYLYAHRGASDQDIVQRFNCSLEAAKRLRYNDNGRYAPKASNVKAQIEAFLAQHPNVLNSEIADAVGCSVSSVHRIMKELRPKPDRRATRARALEHLNRSKQSQPLDQ